MVTLGWVQVCGLGLLAALWVLAAFAVGWVVGRDAWRPLR